MKICLIGSASSIHISRWANSLTNRGHQVYIITMSSSEINNINRSVKVYQLTFPPPIGYFLNAFEAKSLIAKIKPDIVHSHYASGFGTLSRLVKFKPTILSVWGSDIYLFPYKNKYNMFNIQKNLNSADIIGSTSLDMKMEVQKLIGDKKEVAVTPFGVDTKKFYPIEKTSPTITIGTVKTMAPVYGTDYLLKAFKKLIVKVPENIEIEFLLVGGGNVEYYRNLSKNLGIDHLTKFTDQIPHDNVPEYLNKLDIYCAPSLSESFGVAALEASACGLPVVVSNVGGFPEVVKENQTGYLVPPQNAEVLADKILDLVLNENRRKVFGKNGRKFVLENYDWEVNVDNMEEVYANLLNRAKKEK